MASGITLVLGGVRSGKSAFAEKLAESGGQPVLYAATGVAADEDMQERIRRHRQRRPAHWTTLEEPLSLPEGLEKALGVPQPPPVVLVDSLDGWVSNLLLEGGDSPGADLEVRVSSATERLLEVCHRHPADFVLVSSEVGLSPVAPHELGRRFQDLLGLVNQQVAAGADAVHLVVAGVPVEVKGHRGK